MGRVTGSGWVAALFVGAGVMAAGPSLGAAQSESEERRRVGVSLALTEAMARPMLGVYVAEDRDDGVVVARLSPGGPAEEAGILDGDVIVSVDGHSLSDPLEDEEGRRRSSSPLQRLRALVGETPEGEALELGIERDGEHLLVEVVPLPGGEFPFGLTFDSEEVGRAMEEAMEKARRSYEGARERYESVDWSRLRDMTDSLRVAPLAPLTRRFDVDFGVGPMWLTQGLDLVDLNPGLGAYFGTDEGVLVANANEDSPLGLLPGDVVVEVDGRTVDDVAELRRILRSYEADEEIPFRIWRDGSETTIVGTVNRR